MERAHTSAPPGHSIIACDHMDQSIFFLPTTNVVGVKLGWEWAHSFALGTFFYYQLFQSKNYINVILNRKTKNSFI